MTLDPSDFEDRSQLADANHILYDQGVLDGFGHVSMRSRHNPEHFLLSRNRAPALVQPDDILTLDLDGNILTVSEHKSFLERFVHAEIYRARPDVMAVVHSHSPSVLPFTIVQEVELKPVCHMSGFIRPQTPVFEISDHAGCSSDLLVKTGELGAHLAHTLGDHAVVLMRGHGVTVVGDTLQQAVFRSVYAEVNARIQSAAMALGTLRALTVGEALAADETNTGQIGRAWSFWLRRAAVNVASLSDDDHLGS